VSVTSKLNLKITLTNIPTYSIHSPFSNELDA
jgi:hypothetical protein